MINISSLALSYKDKTGPFRVPEISNDEIQVSKNLRPPVSEELILFNVFFSKSFIVTSVQAFQYFDKIVLKILTIIKSH